MLKSLVKKSFNSNKSFFNYSSSLPSQSNLNKNNSEISSTSKDYSKVYKLMKNNRQKINSPSPQSNTVIKNIRKFKSSKLETKENYNKSPQITNSSTKYNSGCSSDIMGPSSRINTTYSRAMSHQQSIKNNIIKYIDNNTKSKYIPEGKYDFFKLPVQEDFYISATPKIKENINKTNKNKNDLSLSIKKLHKKILTHNIHCLSDDIVFTQGQVEERNNCIDNYRCNSEGILNEYNKVNNEKEDIKNLIKKYKKRNKELYNQRRNQEKSTNELKLSYKKEETEMFYMITTTFSLKNDIIRLNEDIESIKEDMKFIRGQRVKIGLALINLNKEVNDKKIAIKKYLNNI